MNISNLRFLTTLLATTLTLGALSLACTGGGFNTTPCERGDDNCVCDFPEEEDPDSDSCFIESDDEFGWAWDDDTTTDGAGDIDNDDDTTADDGSDDTTPSYRYVLLEDRTPRTAGDAPGSDIDAVAIEKDGVEFHATSVEDFNLTMDGNDYTDPSQALGPPDSQCEKKNFVSLGGMDNDGYIIFGFANGDDDVTIDSGDRVVVYELGNAVCPNQPTWDNDPTAVSISVSTDRDTFEEIFVTGDGQNVAPIP